MIRIAFIMLCHKEPDQVNRLIKKLEDFQDADVYIHTDLNHPEIRGAIKTGKRVFILPEEESFRIVWGGINMVKATLRMIKTVREAGKRYDYIWLVSGQDYPIIPARETEERLTRNNGANYISTIRPGEERYNFYRKLYEIKYPGWINRDSIPVKILKRLYKTATGGETHTFRLFRRKRPFCFDFMFGSQWWTLTREAAFEILRFSEDHPELLRYFEKTLIPDECYFQTVFMQGKYRETQRNGLTYVSMERSSRHADTLTEQDYEKVTQAGKQYCFARKFGKESQKLIRMIG